jgi:hypothetical protein
MPAIATPDLVRARRFASRFPGGGGDGDVSRRSPAGDARGIALTILATVAVIGARSGAGVPRILLLGIIIAYALNPLVVYLERIRVPRVAATLIVMMGVMSALGFGAYSLRGQVQTIIEQLPEATRTFSTALARLRTDPGGNLQKMQTAAAEVDKATAHGRRHPSPSRPQRMLCRSAGFRPTTFCSWVPWASSGPGPGDLVLF